ncbi:hypothetical protein [Selenomonas ruminantium]|uniref:Uncharacterized protein n=1 Tax=Selenomonas ruminantium TaxID=971 RepID=A0A1I0YBE1_SELRU|nr:hypothetical protein [Selenomonas ruminantium]SFB10669.1 hypothetical protein SAMN05216587_11188 [Selenomonas ruminantium]
MKKLLLLLTMLLALSSTTFATDWQPTMNLHGDGIEYDEDSVGIDQNFNSGRPEDRNIYVWTKITYSSNYIESLYQKGLWKGYSPLGEFSLLKINLSKRTCTVGTICMFDIAHGEIGEKRNWGRTMQITSNNNLGKFLLVLMKRTKDKQEAIVKRTYSSDNPPSSPYTYNPLTREWENKQ